MSIHNMFYKTTYNGITLQINSIYKEYTIRNMQTKISRCDLSTKTSDNEDFI